MLEKLLGRCGNMEEFWKGKKVLVTGHTGFKGGWLSLWLHKLGAEVIGYALEPPTTPSLFQCINLKDKVTSIYGDILDIENLTKVFETYKPEIVLHLAAQPLVRRSYIEPRETFNINIMGTVNLLNLIRQYDCVKAVVNVTSDKCYENKEWHWGYREIEPMGGDDPYSCSKGCSELITNSFRKSYFNEKNIYLASARAGNVIGGGDWAEDRLVPDIINFLSKNEVPIIRNPNAIRPWQYVLEPLYGYMLLAENLWNEGSKYAEGWNFGPENDSIITVSELANEMMKIWDGGKDITFNIDKGKQFHEAQFLKLDYSKAKNKLGWYHKLTIKETLEWTVEWYKAFHKNEDMEQFSLGQLEKYEKLRRNEEIL